MSRGLERIGHLAIRAPNWVGDLVMATPVLAAALSSGRFQRVTILVRRHLREILADGPLESSTVPFENDRDEIARYRELGPDAVLLLTNSFGAAWRALRAGVPVRAGAALRGRGPLLSHRVVPAVRDGRRAPVPTAHLMRDVAGLVGVLVPDLHPRLGIGGFDQALVDDLLRAAGVQEGEGYVVCTPGAAFGAAKLWPPAFHAETLDALHRQRGWRAVVTGAPGEAESVRSVAARCTHPVIDLSGTPGGLGRLKALIAGARLLLVGDSGPRWFAAAFDVPCVSIMGPNFPELTASSLELCEVVRRTDLECAPCLRKICPLGHHRCMRDLQPVEALRAAQRVLEKAS